MDERLKIGDLDEEERDRVFYTAGSIGMKNINNETSLYEFLERVYFWTVNARRKVNGAINRLSDFDTNA